MFLSMPLKVTIVIITMLLHTTWSTFSIKHFIQNIKHFIQNVQNRVINAQVGLMASQGWLQEDSGCYGLNSESFD